MMKKRLSRRSNREKQWTRKHGKHYKVCWNPLTLVFLSVLEVVVQLKEQFTDSDSHLTSLANELCNAKELLIELVELLSSTYPWENCS